MPAHEPDCPRGRWLVRQPKRGLFWVVLFQEGPACECPRLFSPEQSGAVTGGAQVPPTGVNSQVGGAPSA